MSPLAQIADPSSHDAAIAQASATCMVVIYVTSPSNPICTRTAPKVEALAEQYSKSSSNESDLPSETQDQGGRGVKFFAMELTPKTAPMIKFGVQNTPIFICLREAWCETILGADMRKLEGMIREFMGG